MASVSHFGILIQSKSPDRSLYWLALQTNLPLDVPNIEDTTSHPLTDNELGDTREQKANEGGSLLDALFPDRKPKTFVQFGSTGPQNVFVTNTQIQLIKLSEDPVGIFTVLEEPWAQKQMGTLIWDDQAVFYDGWVCTGSVFYANHATLMISEISHDGQKRYLPMWVNGMSGASCAVNTSATKGDIDCPAGTPMPIASQTFLGTLESQDPKLVLEVLTNANFNLSQEEAQAIVTRFWPWQEDEEEEEIEPEVAAPTFTFDVVEEEPVQHLVEEEEEQNENEEEEAPEEEDAEEEPTVEEETEAVENETEEETVLAYHDDYENYIEKLLEDLSILLPVSVEPAPKTIKVTTVPRSCVLVCSEQEIEVDEDRTYVTTRTFVKKGKKGF